MIRAHFSGLTNPVPERPRPNYDVPEQPETRFAIVTDKDSAGLEILRHSTAHLLAYAVKELFPDAQVTIGPVIEHTGMARIRGYVGQLPQFTSYAQAIAAFKSIMGPYFTALSEADWQRYELVNGTAMCADGIALFHEKRER